MCKALKKVPRTGRVARGAGGGWCGGRLATWYRMRPNVELPFTADEHQSDVIMLGCVVHEVIHLSQYLLLKLL